jgi:hypothetical protein
MTAIASRAEYRAAGADAARLRLPLWFAVLLSRLVVLAGGIAGALFATRAAGWQEGDPQHLTLQLGSLGDLLAAAGVRWDSLHYLLIAAHGYNTGANADFFPLYPQLIRVGAWVTSSDVIAGLLISAVAFAVAMLLLHQLVSEELGVRPARATVLLLAFSPVSLFFTAIYTESLFLALTVGALLLARRGRFGWAGVAAAAATLTHIQGVLLIAPLAIFYFQDQAADLRVRPAAGYRVVAAVRAVPLALPLAALAGFLLYLHSRGFGWLAPFSDQRYYGRHFTGPVIGVAQGLSAGFRGLVQMLGAVAGGSHGGVGSHQQAFADVVSLAVLVICAAAFIAAWRRLPKAYSVYGALGLLTCVSSPAHGAPLTSLDRFALVLFPFWIGAAAWLVERRLLRGALIVSTTLMFVFAFEFGRWAFIG